ncbi:MAG TPA: hypothetical protein H9881_18580 [Candidatus Stackebrandtia excrementipullorum]|nr:hypothetical protein [Candidatus Stackebrandtia excrementipullorum]
MSVSVVGVGSGFQLDREWLLREVERLSYAEVAMALVHSSMPGTWKAVQQWEPDERREWVIEGLARLGVAGVIKATEEGRKAVRAQDWNAHSKVWGKERRRRLAHDVSFQLVVAGKDAA